MLWYEYNVIYETEPVWTYCGGEMIFWTCLSLFEAIKFVDWDSRDRVDHIKYDQFRLEGKTRLHKWAQFAICLQSNQAALNLWYLLSLLTEAERNKNGDKPKNHLMAQVYRSSWHCPLLFPLSKLWYARRAESCRSSPNQTPTSTSELQNLSRSRGRGYTCDGCLLMGIDQRETCAKSQSMHFSAFWDESGHPPVLSTWSNPQWIMISRIFNFHQEGVAIWTMCCLILHLMWSILFSALVAQQVAYGGIFKNLRIVGGSWERIKVVRSCFGQWSNTGKNNWRHMYGDSQVSSFLKLVSTELDGGSCSQWQIVCTHQTGILLHQPLCLESFRVNFLLFILLAHYGSVFLMLDRILQILTRTIYGGPVVWLCSGVQLVIVRHERGVPHDLTQSSGSVRCSRLASTSWVWARCTSSLETWKHGLVRFSVAPVSRFVWYQSCWESNTGRVLVISARLSSRLVIGQVVGWQWQVTVCLKIRTDLQIHRRLLLLGSFCTDVLLLWLQD